MNSFVLNKIIEEEIRRLISEKLSEKIFHFCPMSACFNIVMSNSLRLSSVEQNINDKRMNSFQTGKDTFKIYPYYMCFSRTQSTADGYVRARRENSPDWRKATVRIEFDGDLLNRYFYGKPVNAFIDKDSKMLNQTGAHYAIPEKPGLLQKKEFLNLDNSLKISTSYEHEDRLYSNERIIKSADKFIKEIDILLHPDFFTKPESFPEIAQMLGKMLRNHTFGSRIRIYNNEKAFNSLGIRDSIGLQSVLAASNRAKRKELGNKYNSVNINDFKKNYSTFLKNKNTNPIVLKSGLLGNIAKILSVISFNNKNCDGKYYNDTLRLAKFVGLGGYIDVIKEKIPNLKDLGAGGFAFMSKMYNNTMVNLRTQEPEIFEKIDELVKNEEEKLGKGMFYAKGIIHRKIFGF